MKNKINRIFEIISFMLAIIIVARISLPILNIMISGIVFEIIFVFWLITSLLSYINTFKINRNDLFLLLFPILYLLYIAVCNALKNEFVDTDFTVVFNFLMPIYFFVFYKNNNRLLLYKLSKIFLFLYFITTLTTLYHLFSWNYYSRLITGSNVHDISMWYKNIGNINFVSASIILIPLTLYLLFYTKQKRILKIAEIIFVLVLILLVVKASFSIILICVLLGIILIFSLNKYFIFYFIIIILILTISRLYILDIFMILSKNLNDVYAQRINELVDFILNENILGDFNERINAYYKSLNYFSNNVLFGLATGEYYNRSNTLGYHSELIDTYARYGALFSTLLIIYFKSYFKSLKSMISNIKFKQIHFVSVIVILIYSILNPMFSSYPLSYSIFLVLPTIENYIK